MTEEEVQPVLRGRNVLWLVLAALTVLLGAILIPPYISISRYQKSITELMSRSLGRPVRLSSVELRLLPWPGFVLSDLTVEEDPSYGAEPILHANTVKASIRLLSLWRGRLEIDSISVDEASLNLVRTPNGFWNLDPLFQTAAAHAKSAARTEPNRRTVQLPYLEATNSRVNFKNGLEKLPFSLVGADLSFWQEKPGEWRLRLKGQPARTDVTLDLADTGLVQMEASLHSASELRQMPIRLDMQWREARLGQLSRLLIGSDPGWRGDLTWQLHLDGTPDYAHVTTRLSATGVHRAEFAPAEPLDFDANCKFDYGYTLRKIENLSCDSPLGDGHMHLDGALPGDAPQRLTLSLDRISAQAGLSLLRTVRSGVADDLQAHGSITGKLNYDPIPAGEPAGNAKGTEPKATTKEVPKQALSGSLQVTGFSLSGGPLDQPLQFADFRLVPINGANALSVALQGESTVTAGGAAPLLVSARLGQSRFALKVQGAASYKRLQQVAQLAGIGGATEFERLSGSAPEVDLSAEGAWIPAEERPLMMVHLEGGGAADMHEQTGEPDKSLLGTITMHKAVWRPEQLAGAVDLETAVLHLSGGGAQWEGSFSYGPLKGTATIEPSTACRAGQSCTAQVSLNFDQLDAQVLQTALLGAQDKKTLLTSLLAQFTSSSPPAWPASDVSLNANTLLLGQVKLEKAALSVAIRPNAAEIKTFGATLFGGELQVTGTVTNGQKPSYALTGSLEKADPKRLCGYLELRCSGGPIGVSGKVNLTGFTAKDLGATAAGSLHLDWVRGAVQGRVALAATPSPIAKDVARFSRWTGDATIGSSSVTFEQSDLTQGRRTTKVPLVITFGEPPSVSFTESTTAGK